MLTKKLEMQEISNEIILLLFMSYFIRRNGYLFVWNNTQSHCFLPWAHGNRKLAWEVAVILHKHLKFPEHWKKELKLVIFLFVLKKVILLQLPW